MRTKYIILNIYKDQNLEQQRLKNNIELKREPKVFFLNEINQNNLYL